MSREEQIEVQVNSARYPARPKQSSPNFVLGEDKAREMGSACKYFPNKFGFGMIFGETVKSCFEHQHFS